VCVGLSVQKLSVKKHRDGEEGDAAKPATVAQGCERFTADIHSSSGADQPYDADERCFEMMCDGKEARVGKHDWSGLAAAAAAVTCAAGECVNADVKEPRGPCETFGTEYPFFYDLCLNIYAKV
jgi:hypothetical protein